MAKADVFDYIERFYNPRRRHAALGYLGAVGFEKRAYMRLFLDKVELHQDEIRLAGPKAVLAKAALKAMPSSVSEALGYARQWRAVTDKTENWSIHRGLSALPKGI